MAIPPSEPIIDSYSSRDDLSSKTINSKLENFINSKEINSGIVHKFATEILHNKDLPLASPTLIKRAITILNELNAKLNKELPASQPKQAADQKSQESAPASNSSYFGWDFWRRANAYLFGGATQQQKEAAAANSETRGEIGLLLQEFEKLIPPEEELKISELPIKKLQAILEKYPELKPTVISLDVMLESENDFKYLKDNCPNLKDLRCKFGRLTHIEITKDILPDLEKFNISTAYPMIRSLPPTLNYLKLERCMLAESPLKDNPATNLTELELHNVRFFESYEKLLEGLDKLSITNTHEEFNSQRESYSYLKGFKGRYLRIDAIAGDVPASVTHLTTTNQTNFAELPKGLKELRIYGEAAKKFPKEKFDLVKKAPADARVFWEKDNNIFQFHLDSGGEIYKKGAARERKELSKIPELPKEIWGEVAKKLDLKTGLKITELKKELVGNRAEVLLSRFGDPLKAIRLPKFIAIIEKYPELKPRVTSLNIEINSESDLKYLKDKFPNLKDLKFKLWGREGVVLRKDILPNLKHLQILNTHLNLVSLPSDLESLKIEHCDVYPEDQTNHLKELELVEVKILYTSEIKLRLFEGLDKLSIFNSRDEKEDSLPALTGFTGRYLAIDEISRDVPATVTHLTTTKQTNFAQLPEGLKELRIDGEAAKQTQREILDLVLKAPEDARVFWEQGRDNYLFLYDDYKNIKATINHLAFGVSSLSTEILPPKIENLEFLMSSEGIRIFSEEELRKKLSHMPKTLSNLKFKILGGTEETIKRFKRILIDYLPLGATAEIIYWVDNEHQNKISFTKR